MSLLTGERSPLESRGAAHSRRALEVRGVDEIDDLLRAELFPSDSAGVSSSAASLSHSKPQRPGRGKAKVSKFKGDGEDN